MVVFIAWPPESPKTKPGISVLSRTNDPTTGPSVLFSLTNQTESRMTFLIGAPQIKTSGLWPPPQGPQEAIASDLPPHQSTNFTVRMPSESGAWRVRVFYGYLPSGTERFRSEIRYNIRVNWIQLKHGEIPKWFRNQEFNIYAIYSPEVPAQPDAGRTNAANSDMPNR